MGWAEYTVRIGSTRNAYRYKIVIGNSERTRPLWEARHSRVDNIKLDLRKTLREDSSGLG
jgi:hypothetical protein